MENMWRGIGFRSPSYLPGMVPGGKDGVVVIGLGSVVVRGRVGVSGEAGSQSQ
jgi:hypothetical protein